VPPGIYDLTAERGLTTAPRLMRAVEGDHAAQVTVEGLPEPGPTALGPLRRPYHGAGLLLWQDEGNYVRLESAVLGGDPSGVRYALFEVRREGRTVGGLARSEVRLREGPTELRLERRGQDLLALIRQGGDTWREVGRARVDLSRALEVGVAAVNVSGSRLRASFRDFVLDGEAGLAPASPDPLPAPVESLESEGQPAVDEAPRPIKMSGPVYPRAALKRRVEGTVLLEVLIDADGRVARARILRSVPGLDEAAIACAMTWRFKPALKNGKPVPTLAHAPVVFRID
jgi:TonB family protein